MGHLLVPSAKHDHGNFDFWGAFKDTELLYHLNWCRYVYAYLMEAAQKARHEMIAKGRVTYLSGCHLFLQVLFLDNVDLRALNKDHNILPRIKAFDQESIRRMATMCASRGEADYLSFIGLRPKNSLAYMRHTFQSDAHIGIQDRIPTKVCISDKDAEPSYATNSDITPDNWCFASPYDSVSYIHAKYPTMRNYATPFRLPVLAPRRPATHSHLHHMKQDRNISGLTNHPCLTLMLPKTLRLTPPPRMPTSSMLLQRI